MTEKLLNLQNNGRTQVAAAGNLHAPAANTAAVVTKAAGGAGTFHTIRGVDFSYAGSGTLAGGNLKIEDVSGTTVYSLDVQTAGTYMIRFPRALKSAAANTAMIVTLAAGSANVSGKVNVVGYSLES